MERLTERIKRLQKDDLIVYTNGKYEDTIPAEMTNDDIRAVLKKLADYEDLEEQGLLVRLPVATGTNVYVVGSFLDSPEMVTVSCDEMEQIFEYCGVPDEKLSDFKENWEMYFSSKKDHNRIDTLYYHCTV